MKKMKRVLALVLTFVLCLSLCGCRQLDDMKAHHATWMENGNILWNGYTYIPLYSTDEAFYYEYADDLNWSDREVIYVTQPDVPVLLSEMMGTYGYTGGNDLLIEANGYVAISSYEESYTNRIYCRADYYDWTLDALQNGYEIREYGYYFYDYDTGEEKQGTLTSAQRQAIEDVLNTVTPITGSDESYYDYYLSSLTISGYSTAHLFGQDVGELYYDNGIYSIFVSYYDDEYNRYDKLYDIPEKYTAMFDELFDKVGIHRNVVSPSTSITLGNAA